MSEVNLKFPEQPPVEPFIKLETHPQEKYDSLVDFYYESITNFSYMISRAIPKELVHGKTGDKLEKYSSHQGIKAFKQCIDMLKRQQSNKVIKPVDIEYKEYKYLYDWYFDSIVNFISLSVNDKHSKFKDVNEVDMLIRAFKKAIKKLKEGLKSG